MVGTSSKRSDPSPLNKILKRLRRSVAEVKEMCGRGVAELTGKLCGAAVKESSSAEGMIFPLTPFHRTTACTRPRFSLDVIENLDGFEVECAAGDAWR